MHKNRGSARNRLGVRVWWEHHRYFGPSFYLDRWCIKDGDKQVDGKVWWAWLRWINRSDGREGRDVPSIEKLAQEHRESMELAGISPDVEWPKPRPCFEDILACRGGPELRIENTPVYDNANPGDKDAIAFFGGKDA